MKVLLIGSGGREHALAWALGRSPLLQTLRCAPGSAAIGRLAPRVDLELHDLEGLVSHVAREGYDLVVVGPEAPLVNGLADRLREAGTAVFGPSAGAARIEGSKAYAKQLMDHWGVPTARHTVLADAAGAADYLASSEAVYPLVIKADGLAAGKGVFMADDVRQATSAVGEILTGLPPGAGSLIVIEERLQGEEASFFVLTDGERLLELASCKDYKRAFDGDRGPNTGGMGSYSPHPGLDAATRRRILDSIIKPVIHGLAADGHPYRGVLYAGLMLTSDGPKVLEFNARFGDPEAQVLLPRLAGDWLPLLQQCAAGRLVTEHLNWDAGAAVCVVMASGGYPQAFGKGQAISGIERAESMEDTLVFHSGTTRDAAGRWVTAGGRVLGITALGTNLRAARTRAYAAVSSIHWDGEHHRTDIAENVGSSARGTGW